MAFSEEKYSLPTAPQFVKDGIPSNRINLAESNLVHPSHSDGFVDVLDPVIGAGTVGVALASAAATGDAVAIQTDGVVALSVVSTNGTGNIATAIGDQIYIHPTTAVLSRDPAGIPFGLALNAITTGSTDVINVAVGRIRNAFTGGVERLHIVGPILHTSAAALITNFPMPFDAILKQWVTSVAVLTAGAGTITPNVEGSNLTETIVVPDASTVGTVILDPVTTDTEEILSAGDEIDLTSDGTPTAGEIVIYADVYRI